ncbi:hypothetical protein CPHO_05505 [Corynebacterium phocae]|uniref:Thiol peroxidase n=1 Tax=Corynebacterium phocae TaxID=161895 RepID=A0A1L7D2T5_9CORY|nr:thiol peroxidase [Corynebacterium phocae]APT92428.1 hypothetical protein CPHO_05505 [Corynebacterium phocae]KAA8725028.1 thiol peroxidase [Corynebacterium phocae]
MTQITFKNEPANTCGELPAVGAPLPHFELVGGDLSTITGKDFAGKKLVLSFFPSVDTGVCAQSVRTFNEKAAGKEDTVVLVISADLPFAQGRFCSAEGIDNVVAGSTFRSSFGKDFGVELSDSPLEGLLARGVIVTDADHKVVYTQLVGEVTEEPDYDAAINAL